MNGMQGFGEFVNELRIRRRISLRAFCAALGLDAEDWSGVERGLMPPPQEAEILATIAQHLGLQETGEEWARMHELARAEWDLKSRPPLSEREQVAALPKFFRTLHGKPSRDDLKRFAELVKER